MYTSNKAARITRTTVEGCIGVSRVTGKIWSGKGVLMMQLTEGSKKDFAAPERRWKDDLLICWGDL